LTTKHRQLRLGLILPNSVPRTHHGNVQPIRRCERSKAKPRDHTLPTDTQRTRGTRARQRCATKPLISCLQGSTVSISFRPSSRRAVHSNCQEAGRDDGTLVRRSRQSSARWRGSSALVKVKRREWDFRGPPRGGPHSPLASMLDVRRRHTLAIQAGNADGSQLRSRSLLRPLEPDWHAAPVFEKCVPV